MNMHPRPWFYVMISVSMVLVMGVMLTGCDRPVIHQKSVAQLNQKASQLMQMGDTAGAVSRLESAHDLVPDDGLVLYNLGIAYQANNQLKKSAETLSDFLKKHPNDKKYGAALQSLAVVWEERGDQLLMKGSQDETEEGQNNPVEKRKEQLTEGIASIEQAIKVYDLLKARQKKESAQQAVDEHVEQLSDMVDKQTKELATLS